MITIFVPHLLLVGLILMFRRLLRSSLLDRIRRLQLPASVSSGFAIRSTIVETINSIRSPVWRRMYSKHEPAFATPKVTYLSPCVEQMGYPQDCVTSASRPMYKPRPTVCMDSWLSFWATMAGIGSIHAAIVQASMHNLLLRLNNSHLQSSSRAKPTSKPCIQTRSQSWLQPCKQRQPLLRLRTIFPIWLSTVIYQPEHEQLRKVEVLQINHANER
jgi:hypothetical protein